MKKFLFISLAFAAVFYFQTALFSQEAAPAAAEETVEEKAVEDHSDTEVKGEEKKAEDTLSEAEKDKPADAAKEVSKEQAIMQAAEGAKIYNDGTITYINSKVMFELKTKDNIYEDKVFYKVDADTEKEYSNPFNIEQDGKHSVVYYGVDKMGNREDAKSINITVDTKAPETSVTMNAPFVKVGEKLYVSESFVYNYSIAAKDELSGVANILYSTDGENYEEYVAPFELSAKEPQKLSVIVQDRVGNITNQYISKIIDEAGNVLAAKEGVDIIVDKKSPTVEVKSDKEFVEKDGKKIAASTYKYQITAADDESGVGTILYRLDSKGDFTIYTGEIEFSENGDHLIEAIAKDKVGNISQTVKLPVYVDVIAPVSEVKMVTGK